MKFLWQNREYSVDTGTKIKQSTNPSSLHLKMRKIVEEIYPFEKVAEEFPLLGTKPRLFADFYIPALDLIIEVHGKQHFEYNTFFYKNKQDFFKAKARDNLKYEWCDENSIILLEVAYDQSEQEWKEIIRKAKRI